MSKAGVADRPELSRLVASGKGVQTRALLKQREAQKEVQRDKIARFIADKSADVSANRLLRSRSVSFSKPEVTNLKPLPRVVVVPPKSPKRTVLDVLFSPRFPSPIRYKSPIRAPVSPVRFVIDRSDTEESEEDVGHQIDPALGLETFGLPPAPFRRVVDADAESVKSEEVFEDTVEDQDISQGPVDVPDVNTHINSSRADINDVFDSPGARLADNELFPPRAPAQGAQDRRDLQQAEVAPQDALPPLGARVADRQRNNVLPADVLLAVDIIDDNEKLRCPPDLGRSSREGGEGAASCQLRAGDLSRRR